MEPPPPGPNGGDDEDDANRPPPPNDDDDVDDVDVDVDDNETDFPSGGGGGGDDKIENELIAAIQREDPLDAIRSIVERRRLPQSVQTSQPLRTAIGRGSPLEIVKYVDGCYPDAIREIAGDDQDLPLHHVTRFTRPECVEFLIDRHPEALAARNRSGELPLYRALERCAGRTVIQMLVEGRPQSIAEFDPQGRRVPPRLLPVHVAATTMGLQQLDVVRYLVQLSPGSVRERTPPDWGDELTGDCLPLHLAIQHLLHPQVIRLLLDQWRESAQERWGLLLPLHLALDAIEPSEEVVRILLDAYPDAVRDTDSRWSTVFHIAFSDELELTPLELLPTLIEYWPEALLVADADGDLPIHVALRRERNVEPRADVLSMACPDSLRVANSNGQRPLHLAIARNSLPVVRMFENRSPGLLREAADAEGNTPAHLVAACEQASPDLARFVVEAWPESLLAVNTDGDTPTHVAIDRALPSSEALGVFLEHRPESLRVANLQGRRPLFVAIARNHAEIVRLIVAIVPEAARHVDVRGRRTALHCAASREGLSPDLLPFLAETWPAALNMRDAEGNLPLFLAAENDSISLNSVFLFLKKRPNVVAGRRRGAKRPRSSSSESEGLARSAKRPRPGSPSVG